MDLPVVASAAVDPHADLPVVDVEAEACAVESPSSLSPIVTMVSENSVAI